MDKKDKRPTERKLIERRQEIGFFEKWFSSTPTATVTKEVLEVDLEWLNTLNDMGFDRELAFNALTHSKNFEEALNLLTKKSELVKAPVSFELFPYL